MRHRRTGRGAECTHTKLRSTPTAPQSRADLEAPSLTVARYRRRGRRWRSEIGARNQVLMGRPKWFTTRYPYPLYSAYTGIDDCKVAYKKRRFERMRRLHGASWLDVQVVSCRFVRKVTPRYA